MVDDLAAAVAGAPPDAHLCVFHSWVVAYLPPERSGAGGGHRRRRPGAAGLLGLRRAPLRGARAAGPAAAGEGGDRPCKGGDRPGAGRRRRGGRRRARRLADVHPHGRWLHWWRAWRLALGIRRRSRPGSSATARRLGRRARRRAPRGLPPGRYGDPVLADHGDRADGAPAEAGPDGVDRRGDVRPLGLQPRPPGGLSCRRRLAAGPRVGDRAASASRCEGELLRCRAAGWSPRR